MSHFTRIAEGYDVGPLLRQIDAQPQLWNTHAERRVPQSPHRETDDMWVRYRHPDELTGPESYTGPHFSVWWPAWHALPALHPIVYDLSARVRSVHMGGILMTRIPPGGRVYPHHDRGTWHAEYHNTKIWMPLRSNEGCVNRVEDEAMVWRPGEAWSHDNLLTHSVENNGDNERIVLICCFRTE